MPKTHVKIMIADDHAGFRQMVKTVLAPLAADFLECKDGQETLAEYGRFLPDIVLMDIAMEGLDGLKATAQLKAIFPDARILMLTQYDDPDLREAAQKAGAYAYVLKEDLFQLKAVITASLGS